MIGANSLFSAAPRHDARDINLSLSTPSEAGIQANELCIHVLEESSYTLNYEWLTVGFIADGQAQLSHSEGDEQAISSGQWFFLFQSESNAELELSPNCQGLIVRYPRQAFQELIKTSTRIPEKLSCLLCPRCNYVHLESGNFNGRISGLVDALLDADSNDLNARLILGGLAHELLARVLQEPVFARGNCCKQSARKNDDICTLETVASYLEENLEEEHSLATICRHHAINEFKLKKGFRELYGN
ncbi:MAG: hypothetical protein AAGF10_03020, partial [Verrucomicrobiota bacterium]